MRNTTKITVICLLIIILFDSIERGLLFPTATALIINNSSGFFAATTSYKLRNFIFEIYLAIYCFCLFFFAPLLGAMSDRYGRKKILIIAILGSFVEFLLSMMAVKFNKFIFLIFGRMIAGMTAGTFAAVQAGLIDISISAEKPKRLGWVMLTNGIGFALGPIIYSFIIKKYHMFILPYFIGALFCFFGIILVYYFFMKPLIISLNPKKNSYCTVFFSIQNAFFDIKIRNYFITYFLSWISYTAFFGSLTVFFANKFHLSGSSVGFCLTIFSIFSSIGLLILLPIILKYFHVKKVIFYLLVIQGLASFLFYFPKSLPITLFLSLPVATILPILNVCLTTLISNSTDIEHQGKIMGVASAVEALCWAIGPLIAGLLISLNLNLLYYIELIFLIISAFYFKKRFLIINNGLT